MNTTYVIYKNGFKVMTIERSSDDEAIEYAGAYALNHPSEWIMVIRISPRETIYKKCHGV